MATNDPLDRFVQAQDERGTYASALAELRAGAKRSHWMWFVFPQIAGLGQSPTARFYAIAGLDEARTYLAHPVLGARLLESIDAALESPASSAQALLGGIDAMKLRSCATLFLRAAPDEPRFQRVLDRFYDGAADPVTDRILSA